MKKIQSYLNFNQTITYLKYLTISLLGLLFVVQTYLSLSWPICCDAAFIHYIAYLISDHGYVPYRDIFEVNMPGIYLLHMMIGKVLGYSDFAFQIVNNTWLIMTMVVTWLIVKPFGKLVALGGCLLFALIYQNGGPQMSFEREFIAILPVALAILVSVKRKIQHSIHFTHVLQGVLFGLAVLIKPHMLIGLPALIIYNYFHTSDESITIQQFVKFCTLASIFTIIGFLVTIALPFLWLWYIGGLTSFWEILSSFSPLYVQMTGEFEFIDSQSRILYLIKKYLMFDRFELLPLTSFFGLYFVLTTSLPDATKKIAVLLLSLTFIYSLYPIIGGKLWGYHWIPFIYFACICTGLLFVSSRPTSKTRYAIFFPFIALMFTIILTIRPAIATKKQLAHSKYMPNDKNKMVNEITNYLNQHVSPTDKIQPLDWISGGINAMLRSGRPIATPYVTDFQFYHHTSNPYIQELRHDFLIELNQSMPDVLIDVEHKPKLSGKDVSYNFVELEEFIKKNYKEDYKGNGFKIYRKNNDLK